MATPKITQLGTYLGAGTGQTVVGVQGDHTFTATLTGAGAIAASVVIQGSNDLLGWTTLATLAPSGTNLATATAALSASYAYWSATVSSITAGAQLSVLGASEEGVPGSDFTPLQAANLKALSSAYSAQPATWYNGEINSVVTPSIVADGDLTTATDQVPKWWLIVVNAADDVEAAQRILSGGPNVIVLLPGQAIQPPVQDWLGQAKVVTSAHAVCISTAVTPPADYTGGAYMLAGAGESLANALANMVKWQWSSGLACTAFRAVSSPVYNTNYAQLMVAAGV